MTTVSFRGGFERRGEFLLGLTTRRTQISKGSLLTLMPQNQSLTESGTPWCTALKYSWEACSILARAWALSQNFSFQSHPSLCEQIRASGELPSLLVLLFPYVLSGGRGRGAMVSSELFGALKWHHEVNTNVSHRVCIFQLIFLTQIHLKVREKQCQKSPWISSSKPTALLKRCVSQKGRFA